MAFGPGDDVQPSIEDMPSNLLVDLLQDEDKSNVSLVNKVLNRYDSNYKPAFLTNDTIIAPGLRTIREHVHLSCMVR